MTKPLESNKYTYLPELRPFLWVILIGGIQGLTAVPIALLSTVPMMAQAAIVYKQFPSIPTPWFARKLTYPPGWGLGMLVFASVFPWIVGLLVVRLTRPADRRTDLWLGAATGAVTGVTTFVFSVGIAYVLAVTLATQLTDLTWLKAPPPVAASSDAPVNGAIEARYPDLAGVPFEEQRSRVVDKLIVDQFGAVTSGIIVSAGLALAGSLAWAIAQVLLWGHVLRSAAGDRFSVLIGFLELVVPGCCLASTALTFNPFGAFFEENARFFPVIGERSVTIAALLVVVMVARKYVRLSYRAAAYAAAGLILAAIHYAA